MAEWDFPERLALTIHDRLVAIGWNVNTQILPLLEDIERRRLYVLRDEVSSAHTLLFQFNEMLMNAAQLKEASGYPSLDFLDEFKNAITKLIGLLNYLPTPLLHAAIFIEQIQEIAALEEEERKELNTLIYQNILGILMIPLNNHITTLYVTANSIITAYRNRGKRLESIEELEKVKIRLEELPGHISAVNTLARKLRTDYSGRNATTIITNTIEQDQIRRILTDISNSAERGYREFDKPFLADAVDYSMKVASEDERYARQVEEREEAGKSSLEYEYEWYIFYDQGEKERCEKNRILPKEIEDINTGGIVFGRKKARKTYTLKIGGGSSKKGMVFTTPSTDVRDGISTGAFAGALYVGLAAKLLQEPASRVPTVDYLNKNLRDISKRKYAWAFWDWKSFPGRLKALAQSRAIDEDVIIKFKKKYEYLNKNYVKPWTVVPPPPALMASAAAKKNITVMNDILKNKQGMFEPYTLDFKFLSDFLEEHSKIYDLLSSNARGVTSLTGAGYNSNTFSNAKRLLIDTSKNPLDRWLHDYLHSEFIKHGTDFQYLYSEHDRQLHMDDFDSLNGVQQGTFSDILSKIHNNFMLPLSIAVKQSGKLVEACDAYLT